MIHAEIRRRDRRNARFWFGALVVGILAAGVMALIDDQPVIKLLFALVAFIGIFGFLAFLSTKKPFRGCVNDLFYWS